MDNKPNIIIFNVDQWRGDVLGHLGNPAAITPNLDKIVETDAVSFSNAFCQNPVCTPSRCSFMTGWYPHVKGHRTMHHMLHLERDEPNLLGILRDTGYYIWWGGRNDLIPAQHDLREYCDIYFWPSKEDLNRWGHKWKPNLHISDKWRGTPESDNYYSFFAGKLDTKGDDIYFDFDWAIILGAIDFIQAYDGEKPLCMYIALANPHPPYGIEEPWYSIIDRNKLPQRKKTPKEWSEKPSLLKGIYDRQNLQEWTEDRWSELRATYYGMCARLDHQFGLIIDELKKKNYYNDTAIFLFSDHGDFTGDYGLVEKTQNTFEDCLTRIPFIIKPPSYINVNPRVCDALVELVDFSETVYALTSLNPNYSRFGKSLIPLLKGETESHRDAVFCEGGRLYGEKHAMELESTSALIPSGLYWPRVGLQITDDGPYHGKAVMCRTKDFKYVQRLYEKDELYDLINDSEEINNLIDDSKYKDILINMKERMLIWYVETCDVVPFEIDWRFSRRKEIKKD
ncbi:MAG: sulfatase-like hydrolase/transferase [Candidatus Lokiarchaeota archaeon]|nr:sulfatase-like hydrolase/transferase [Candidatus Lokiarchaeota archaeon]